jgi:hypothetical protein
VPRARAAVRSPSINTQFSDWIDTEERLATLDRIGAVKLRYTSRL